MGNDIIIIQPTGTFRLGDFLKQSFANPQWSEFRAAIAFVKQSGTKHIRQPLELFSKQGGKVKVSAGIDAGGTSLEGLKDLLEAVEDRGQVFVFKNANSSTFHPKVYLFKNEKEAELLVGSGNLTEGGLFTNYEAGLLLRLSLDVNEHAELLTTVEHALDAWSIPTDRLCYKLDLAFLQKLVEEEYLPDERTARGGDESKVLIKQGPDKTESLFARRPVPAAPYVAKTGKDVQLDRAEDEQTDEISEDEDLIVINPPPVPSQPGTYNVFLMTLQNTDVGVGQTTIGTSRRSPEIFIPLICRDYDPLFWGWPNDFLADPEWTGPLDGNERGKMDRAGVMVRLGGDTFPVTMWYNPDKRDLRIRSEHMRSAGNVGDILYVERSDGASGFAYYVEVIPQGTARHAEFLAKCTQAVRNSRKRWAYL